MYALIKKPRYVLFFKCRTSTQARMHTRRRTAVELLSLRRTERMSVSPPSLWGKKGVWSGADFVRLLWVSVLLACIFFRF